MFGRKHKINKLEYNPDIEKPVIISSICTGEQRAGIKDIKTVCDVQDVEVEY